MRQLEMFSLEEAAKEIGVHPLTLHEWVSRGKIEPSYVLHLGKNGIRLWTEEGLERLQEYKQNHYKQNVGRPRVKASKGQALA